MRNTYYARLAVLLLAASAPGAARADGDLVIDLPGLPPPPPPRVQPRRQPAPQPGDVASSRPPMRQFANTLPTREIADRVGRLGVVVSRWATITRLPQFYLRPLARVATGTYMVIKEERPGWYAVLMIDGSIGWLPATDVRLLDYDVVKPGSNGAEGTDGSEPFEAPSAEGIGGAVLREAYRFLGVPYVWGGNGGSGIDCSGLVKTCFSRCGRNLPRRASEQALVGEPVPFSDWAYLQPGDRLYFAVKGSRIDHTGLYVGNGYFIHSSMSRGGVGVDRLSRPLFRRSIVAARRTVS